MPAEKDRLSSYPKEEINPWKKWGAYVSERSWGNVREDYSGNGDAWDYTSHDSSRSHAYRWGEDGIAGCCDFFQTLVFSWAFWNGKDPILKERMFGLSSTEGNHGEDIKEYFFYLDSTPTGSYMKYLYKYPQGEFPYQKLIDENQKRGTRDREYELIDTGIFEGNRYFDIVIEYAKASPEDLAIRIEIFNRGPEEASIHVLPQLLFRNRWSWESEGEKWIPEIKEGPISKDFASLHADPKDLPPATLKPASYQFHPMYLYGDPGSKLLFTNNETNFKKLYNAENRTPYVKDAFHRHLIQKENCVHKDSGTKGAFAYEADIPSGGSKVFHLRLTSENLKDPLKDIESIIALRKKEADEFYKEIQSPKLSPDDKKIQRQAFAGMLWSRQFYCYDVERWFEGDPTFPPPPEPRNNIRNTHWRHMRANSVISMPDKWEYPWFAAWDLCFHSVALAKIDSALAKEQLHILLKHQYLHPNGQIPAYEWGFSDLNPPVQAWAALRIFHMDGSQDYEFLEHVFLKLIINFTWWVNKVDKEGNNFFEGGFLGLDNISIIDRSKPLQNGGFIEESDGTGWMAFFSLTLMRMALELTQKRPHFEGMAIMFFEHFIYISHALHTQKGRDVGMWNDEDGFLYDVICYPNGSHSQLKIRSLVGIIPLFSIDYFDDEEMKKYPVFYENFHLFLKDKAQLTNNCIYPIKGRKGTRYLLSLLSPDQIEKTFHKIWDPNEFLSPYGLRSISKFHEKNPLHFEGTEVSYEPGESLEKVKGGNSNWRGPVWIPTNFLFLDALVRFKEAVGDEWRGFPLKNLTFSFREQLINLFRVNSEKKRPSNGDYALFNDDPNWQDLILFYEHYHGDNGRGLGASHQTGWSGLAAILIDEIEK